LVKVILQRPHRSRGRTVQSYSQVAPVCPAMWAHWHHMANAIKRCLLRPIGVHNPNSNSISLAFSAQCTAESPYSLQPQLCSIECGSIQCTDRNRNLHISKIWFLFPVSSTIEWKVGIAEFYLHMGFGTDLLKKTAEIGIHTLLKSASYFRFD